MKIPSFFLAAMLLTSCRGPFISSETPRDFSQIEHLLIPWEHLLLEAYERYFALVFSLGCQHCLALEDRVVNYALSEKEIPMFFIRATPDIPKGPRIEDTFGATSIDQIFIVGWPTLLEIQNHTLSGQSVGEEAIRRKLS